MNIKEVVDKIRIEADIQKNQYPLENALQDVNARILKLIGQARRISSREPISNGEAFSETFTVVAGSNEFDRTIKNISIFRVDFKPTGSTKYYRIHEDQARGINTWCCDGEHSFCINFFADEKRIFVEEGRSGELRVTYATGEFVKFDENDYDNEEEITWIPEEFHDLIWLYPALRQAGFYKPNRVDTLKQEILDLQLAFNNHYRRNSQWNQKIVTDSPPNYR